MRIVWAYGIESRQATVVLPCLQAFFEDLRALTAGSRLPILRMHSDKAREFLSPVIRTHVSQQDVRQTVNSGHDPQENGLAERWMGIIKANHLLSNKGRMSLLEQVVKITKRMIRNQKTLLVSVNSLPRTNVPQHRPESSPQLGRAQRRMIVAQVQHRRRMTFLGLRNQRDSMELMMPYGEVHQLP